MIANEGEDEAPLYPINQLRTQTLIPNLQLQFIPTSYFNKQPLQYLHPTPQSLQTPTYSYNQVLYHVNHTLHLGRHHE